MDWLGGSFCQDFANSSSITDIVDLVENSGIYDTADEGNVPVEPVVSSFDNNYISGPRNPVTNSIAPGPVEEPAYQAADTTGDSNFYYDGKKREQKRRPKPKDGSQLTCVICGDRALGYNFDAITCESCKAFFRRNANKTKVFTCSFEGNCKLDPHTRKFCSGCRLKKCFEAGMKKEWILSDDQLAKRRKRGSSGSTGDQPIHKQYNPLTKPNGEIGEIERKYVPQAPLSAGSFSDSQGSSSMDSALPQTCQIPNPVKLETFSPQISCEEVTTNYLSDDTDTSSVFANASPPFIKLEKDEDDFPRPLTEEISNNIANLEKEYKSIFDVGYSEEQARKFTEKPHNANELFNMTDIFIRRLIKFAKHIPEFQQLKQEDQILLLKVIYIQAFVFVILMGKLFRKVFFGQLRAAEMEHLIERSWYAVTETCLAFTVFRDDFSPKFVALFTLLLFLKCFHWLAEDRVDYMERSPVISFLFHARVVSLLMFLGVVDLYFVNHAYYSTLIKGASVQLVFGFEYAILMTIVLMTVVKYALHSVDLQSENPWENKAVYLLYSELILGFVKVVLYMVFMIIMIKVHTFPLFAIRPMYLAMRSFKKALHDVIMSRRAIRQMNTLYPEATEEELQSGDNVCIICREDMVTACKKLPCNHIFHTSCLRSWFQRQQTCPTCRMEVLRMPQPRPVPPPQPPPQQPQPPFPNMFQNGMPGFPQMPPMWPPQQFQPQQQEPQTTQVSSTTTTPVSSTSTSASSTAATTTSSTGTAPTFTWPGATPQSNMPFMPMFPMFMPNSFPRPPASMSGLSVEELRAMEGIERENIEARIQWLRDIQALLDGAMLLINQYNTVAANSSISGISVPRETQSPAPKSEESKVPLSSPPRGAGARPKYSSVKTESSTLDKTENNSSIDLSSLEGATGYSPPKEELIPEWEDPTKEEHGDEMDEVRRRRLEKFLTDNSQTNSETKKSVAPHQD